MGNTEKSEKKYSTQSGAAVLVLQQILAEERNRLKQMTDEREELPDGSLYMRLIKNKPYYCRHAEKKTIGISRDQDCIYGLARSEYLGRLITISTYLCEKLDGCIKEVLQTVADYSPKVAVESLAKKQIDPNRVALTQDQFEWIASQHSMNPYRPEDLKFITTNGIKVRSKSEQAIANLLEENGVPYRYECEMQIGGRTMYPDFVIMLPDGRLIIWEHLGRMDLIEYARDVGQRLCDYNQEGYLIGRNLFLSFEEDMLDLSWLKRILAQVLTA